VIDDDLLVKHMLVNYLEQHDMRVALASQRQDVVRQFAVGEPSLFILDLQLGQENGLDLLREIRSRSDVPVIITTGRRCDEIDRVVGLELGADDYVTKPFGPTRLHEDVFDRSIDVQILRLRRKLEADPSAPRIIRTERGVGYVFALSVEPL
jgi:DNA-binding response OmpR family regulator